MSVCSATRSGSKGMSAPCKGLRSFSRSSVPGGYEISASGNRRTELLPVKAKSMSMGLTAAMPETRPVARCPVQSWHTSKTPRNSAFIYHTYETPPGGLPIPIQPTCPSHPNRPTPAFAPTLSRSVFPNSISGHPSALPLCLARPTGSGRAVGRKFRQLRIRNYDLVGENLLLL